MPIQEGKEWPAALCRRREKLTGVSRKQKQDLIDAFGLAPNGGCGWLHSDKGSGLDGWRSIEWIWFSEDEKKYPKGLPNALLMRSIESGSSFRKKNPVFRKAVNQSRKKAIDKMGKLLTKRLKGNGGIVWQKNRVIDSDMCCI